MKRIEALLQVIVIICFVIISFNSAWAEETDDIQKTAFVLPAQLEKIEEEAFYGTAVKTVIFPTRLLRVEDGAFDNSLYLTDIFATTTIEYIGDNAFPHNLKYKIHGDDGSYVENWARDHQVQFVQNINLMGRTDTEKELSTFSSTISQYNHYRGSEKEIRLHERNNGEEKSMRPQDRPELYPIDYRFP